LAYFIEGWQTGGELRPFVLNKDGPDEAKAEKALVLWLNSREETRGAEISSAAATSPRAILHERFRDFSLECVTPWRKMRHSTHPGVHLNGRPPKTRR
jgi:hypothetical protein